MGALLMGAIFSKVISTANNYLFSPATNIINDVYCRFINKDATPKHVLVLSRFIVVGLGIFALIQGAYWKSVLEMAMYAYTIYSAAITPVVMAAFFWKRATTQGAVASIAMGTFVTVGWAYGGRHLLPPALAQRDAIFPALIASLLSLVVVSLLTQAPRREQWEPFFANDSEDKAGVPVA
jgi:Na+/proline symporter